MHLCSLVQINVENATDKLIEKLCKRYLLKKGKIVKLVFCIWIKHISTLPCSRIGKNGACQDKQTEG
jgi:hypothetical protein